MKIQNIAPTFPRQSEKMSSSAQSHLAASVGEITGHPQVNDLPSGEDMIKGAKPIAELLFGDRRYWRRVLNLVSQGRVPIVRFGTSAIYARRSTLMEWLEAQELCALAGRRFVVEAPVSRFERLKPAITKAPEPDEPSELDEPDEFDNGAPIAE